MADTRGVRVRLRWMPWGIGSEVAAVKRTIFDELEQGGEAWLQARCGIVTASTMRNLVTAGGKVADNDTARGFIRQLATERIIGVPEFTYPTRPMQRGNLLEPFARDLYAEHYAPVEEVGFIRLDTGDYALGFSPDGLVAHDGLLEIKSPGPKEHLRTILADAVPAVYIWQLQVGLFVTGRSWIDFVSYCPGMDLYVKRVYPDRDMHNTIHEAVTNAEQTIQQIMYAYETTGDIEKRINTEWHDPFAEEEMEF